MCGRLNVTDSPGVRALCEQLEIALWPERGMRFSRFIRAAEAVTAVCEHNGERVAFNAIWWLLLDKTTEHGATRFVPSRYTSFNTRYDKLNVPRSAGYQAYRQQRCVIPATGFGETEGKGSNARYHDFMGLDDTPLLMGGLYRQWFGQDENGEPFVQFSCSVVTLPPHPKLMPFHTKASPLMLSFDDGSAQTWLDSSVTDPEQLAWILNPCVRQTLKAIPIDKPAHHQAVGESIEIVSDLH